MTINSIWTFSANGIEYVMIIQFCHRNLSFTRNQHRPKAVYVVYRKKKNNKCEFSSDNIKFKPMRHGSICVHILTFHRFSEVKWLNWNWFLFCFCIREFVCFHQYAISPNFIKLVQCANRKGVRLIILSYRMTETIHIYIIYIYAYEFIVSNANCIAAFWLKSNTGNRLCLKHWNTKIRLFFLFFFLGFLLVKNRTHHRIYHFW